ncbi:MAG: hypothetical protein SF052_15695 [Bacteroidia bacterium]|nr:hypothetical protein [Bacteroidia bacterium]
MATFPLKKGSRGIEVKTLQQNLNRILPGPIDRLIEDGMFGDRTESAVKFMYGKLEVSQGDFYALSAQGKTLDKMSGEELVTWLSWNDSVVRDELLFIRELLSRAESSGAYVGDLVEDLRYFATRYNTRQAKLKSHPAISAAKYTNKAYDWMMQQWDSIGAIQIPIGAAVILVVVGLAGYALYTFFFQDAKDSQEDLERKIPMLKKAAEKLTPKEYEQLIKETQNYGVGKHRQGQAAGFGGLAAVGIAIAAVLLFK